MVTPVDSKKYLTCEEMNTRSQKTFQRLIEYKLGA